MNVVVYSICILAKHGGSFLFLGCQGGSWGSSSVHVLKGRTAHHIVWCVLRYGIVSQKSMLNS